MVYDALPFAFVTLRGSGVASVRDLAGQRVIDTAGGSGRAILALLAKSEAIEPASVRWVTVAPAIRAQALTSRAGGRGVRLRDDSAWNSRRSASALGISSSSPFRGTRRLLRQCVDRLDTADPRQPRRGARPGARFNRAFREAMADPAEAISYLAQRDPLIDRTLELRR